MVDEQVQIGMHKTVQLWRYAAIQGHICNQFIATLFESQMEHSQGGASHQVKKNDLTKWRDDRRLIWIANIFSLLPRNGILENCQKNP